MNNLSKYILLVLITIILISCKSEISGPEPETAVNIRGVVFDVFLNDSLGYKPESVKIGDRLIDVWMDGTFQDSLLPGEYEVVIESEYHEPFQKTITIDEETSEVFLELENIWVDYFPADVGYKWTFSGSSSVSDPANGSSSRSRRALTWELTERTLDADSGKEIYKGISFYSDTTIYNDGPNEPDTSMSLKNSTFEMIFEDGFVSFGGEAYIERLPEYVYGDFGVEIYLGEGDDKRKMRSSGNIKDEGVPRYFPISRLKSNDLVVELVAASLYKSARLILQPEIGIKLLSYGCCGGNYSAGSGWTLKSFEKGGN